MIYFSPVPSLTRFPLLARHVQARYYAQSPIPFPHFPFLVSRFSRFLLLILPQDTVLAPLVSSPPRHVRPHEGEPSWVCGVESKSYCSMAGRSAQPSSASAGAGSSCGHAAHATKSPLPIDLAISALRQCI